LDDLFDKFIIEIVSFEDRAREYKKDIHQNDDDGQVERVPKSRLTPTKVVEEGYLRRQCAIRDDEDRNHQGVGENQKEEHKNKTLNSKH
jgi:hypothetical protein